MGSGIIPLRRRSADAAATGELWSVETAGFLLCLWVWRWSYNNALRNYNRYFLFYPRTRRANAVVKACPLGVTPTTTFIPLGTARGVSSEAKDIPIMVQDPWLIKHESLVTT